MKGLTWWKWVSLCAGVRGLTWWKWVSLCAGVRGVQQALFHSLSWTSHAYHHAYITQTQEALSLPTVTLFNEVTLCFTSTVSHFEINYSGSICVSSIPFSIIWYNLMGFCADPQCGVFLSPGFFHAPRIPRSDVGEGALSKSYSPRASWTSILKTGRSTILYRSPHETIPASLSRFAEAKTWG